MAKAKPVKKAQTKGSAKAASKPTKVAKAPAKPKVEAKKPAKKIVVPAKKAAPAKATKATDSKKEKELKKTHASEATATEVETVKNNAKAQKAPAKLKSKAKKTEKSQDDDADNDLMSDDFGDSEIAEYEDDLKAVEEDDEDDDSEILSDEDESEARDEEVYLTDSEGRRLCRVRDCDQVSVVDGYCRYHYLLLWKRIQTRKQILLDGKLEKYVDDLMARYPDKFLEVIRKDLRTEKDFTSVIQEMELDESALAEQENDDDAQSFADEIRGLGDAPAMDDDGDY